MAIPHSDWKKAKRTIGKSEYNQFDHCPKCAPFTGSLLPIEEHLGLVVIEDGSPETKGGSDDKSDVFGCSNYKILMKKEPPKSND
jgi:hypothetical protein